MVDPTILKTKKAFKDRGCFGLPVVICKPGEYFFRFKGFITKKDKDFLIKEILNFKNVNRVELKQKESIIHAKIKFN